MEIDDALVKRVMTALGWGNGPISHADARLIHTILTTQKEDPSLCPYPTMTASEADACVIVKRPVLIVDDPPKPEPVPTTDDILILAREAVAAEQLYQGNCATLGEVDDATQALRRAVERLAGGE